jgi:hypothetical protein
MRWEPTRFGGGQQQPDSPRPGPQNVGVGYSGIVLQWELVRRRNTDPAVLYLDIAGSSAAGVYNRPELVMLTQQMIELFAGDAQQFTVWGDNALAVFATVTKRMTTSRNSRSGGEITRHRSSRCQQMLDCASD